MVRTFGTVEEVMRLAVAVGRRYMRLCRGGSAGGSERRGDHGVGEGVSCELGNEACGG